MVAVVENRLVDFIHNSSLETFPDDLRQTVKWSVLRSLGTGIAGAHEDGIAEIRQLAAQREEGGQASVLVFGERVSAQSAAFINATMCRALDFCDAMLPGVHLTSSVLPAALAAAELRGACSGREFLTAMAAGLEVGARLNLTERDFAGLDPTGFGTIFASTAAAARILGLGEKQTLHALGLAFNRCGGSFQSNIDGSLAVRVIQGWVAETAINCAQLAEAGLTGPDNFISGVYGYSKLYCGEDVVEGRWVGGLGERFKLDDTLFKKHPGCGMTQGASELTLRFLAEHGAAPGDIAKVRITLPPHSYNLVGHPFKIGDSPTVDAQFNVAYCVANALVNGGAALSHFKAEAVRSADVAEMIERIEIIRDEELYKTGHSAVEITFELADGTSHDYALTIPPGFPGNRLGEAEQIAAFHQCLDYAGDWYDAAMGERVIEWVGGIEDCADVRELAGLTLMKEGAVRLAG